MTINPVAGIKKPCVVFTGAGLVVGLLISDQMFRWAMTALILASARSMQACQSLYVVKNSSLDIRLFSNSVI